MADLADEPKFFLESTGVTKSPAWSFDDLETEERWEKQADASKGRSPLLHGLSVPCKPKEHAAEPEPEAMSPMQSCLADDGCLDDTGVYEVDDQSFVTRQPHVMSRTVKEGPFAEAQILSAAHPVQAALLNQHHDKDACPNTPRTMETSLSTTCTFETSPRSARSAAMSLGSVHEFESLPPSGHVLEEDDCSLSSCSSSDSSSSSSDSSSSSSSDSSESLSDIDLIDLDFTAYANTKFVLPQGPCLLLHSIAEETSDIDTARGSHQSDSRRGSARGLNSVRRELAAVRLQRVARGRRARVEYRKCQCAALVLQAWSRGRQQRAVFLQVLAAAVRLQHWYRQRWNEEMPSEDTGLDSYYYLGTEVPPTPRFIHIRKSDFANRGKQSPLISEEPQLSSWKPSFVREPTEMKSREPTEMKSIPTSQGSFFSMLQTPPSWWQTFFSPLPLVVSGSATQRTSTSTSFFCISCDSSDECATETCNVESASAIGVTTSESSIQCTTQIWSVESDPWIRSVESASEGDIVYTL